MNHQPPDGTSARERSRVGAFLHELNIARRNLSLYPPGHPRLRDSFQKALQQLQLLGETHPQLDLGVGPESFYFADEWLADAGPTVGELARLLFALGVASLSFRRGLQDEELGRFCQLLRADRPTLDAAGGFPAVLPQQRIEHIQVTPIDYSAFKARKGSGPGGQAAPLWGRFLQGLFDDHLETGHGVEGFDPTLIAEALSQRFSGAGATPLPELSAAIRRLTQTPSTAKLSSAGAKLGQLLGELTPDLQRSVIDSILDSLDQSPEQAAAPLLSALPARLLQANLPATASGISSRLVQLVERLAKNPAAAEGSRLKGQSAPLEEDVVRSRLEVLFHEEQQDSYLPGEYQRALNTILDDDLSDLLPADEQARLRQSVEQQSVERQCGEIICELLEHPLEDQSEQALQTNLLELSRFFLDTGDFQTLRLIHGSWESFVNRRLDADMFAEKLLATHAQQSFVREVLDGVEIWGKDLQAEIGDYIVAVGEPYVEPLIERLGGEKKMTMRRYWMGLLERIGRTAQKPLIDALDDSRWYLVRNLLVLLGRQPDTAVLKAIQPLGDHPHPRVRQEVLKILLRCNPATANRLLLKELASDDPQARLGAVQVAEHSRDPAILARLHLLLSKAGAEQDPAAAKPLLQTLARIGHADSLPLLNQLLQKRSLLPSRRQTQLQQELLRGLAEFPRPLAEPLLRRLAAGGRGPQASLAQELLQQWSRGAS